FYELARLLLLSLRPLGSTPRRGGAAVLWSSCSAPSSLSGFGDQQLLQLAALEHLHHDVRSADEFAFDIELWDRRPIAILLDALADVRVLEHVDGFIFWAEPVEDADTAAVTAAS